MRCQSGEKVVGGGFEPEASLAPWAVTFQSYPIQEGWKVRLGNTGNSHAVVGSVIALCVAG